MMILWVQAHDWTTQRSRAFMFAMYLTTLVPAWFLLYLCFQQRILAPTLAAILSVPALLVATALGLRLGSWLGQSRLRRLTLVLLFIIGVVGILSPWLAGARSDRSMSIQSF